MKLPAVNWRKQSRALAGVAALFCMVWIYALLEMDERLTTLRGQEDRLRQQVARFGAVSQETQWGASRDELQRRMTAFRARAWREESEGRIQAHFQDWLREQLAAGGLKARELVVSLPQAGAAQASAAEPAGRDKEAEAMPAEMRIVRARVTLDFTSDSFNALLARLSASGRWLWVERLTVRNRPPVRTVEIELGALFVIGPREGG